MEGSGWRDDWLFVGPCEIERKLCDFYKTAWSEYMAYVVDQAMVVADLIVYKYGFTVERRVQLTPDEMSWQCTTLKSP